MVKKVETINPDRDGVDHINVYSKGRTLIGRFYSNFFHQEIKTEDGIFASIEAYWYWIKTGGKSPRMTYGASAKFSGKEFKAVCDIDETKIKKALDVKIKNNIKFIFENDNFNLPLAHYYNYSGALRVGGHEWVVLHIELRRTQLKHYLQNKYGKVREKKKC